MKFKNIREESLNYWQIKLCRNRSGSELSDDFNNSILCDLQRECFEIKKHCSFLCSCGQWMDNISDLLFDPRLDYLPNNKILDEEESQALFRFYTRILLVVSEIIEDFITLDVKIMNFRGKKEASAHFESVCFEEGELKSISNFINSVCKHKNESNNLHIHNHHLKMEFEDFGDTLHSNQISLRNLHWELANQDTSILIPRLKYFIEVIALMYKRFYNFTSFEENYKSRLFDLYCIDYDEDAE